MPVAAASGCPNVPTTVKICRCWQRVQARGAHAGAIASRGDLEFTLHKRADSHERQPDGLAVAPMLAASPAPLPSLWGRHLGGLHPHNHTQARHSLLDRAHSALIDAVGRTLALCDGPTGQFSSVAGVLVAAEAVATREQEVILTTLKMDASNLQLVMMRQWMGSLRSRAANVLVVGTDNATCHVLRARKIPCFVDRVAQEHELARDRKIVRGNVNMFGAQVMLKWWYTRALIQNGFHVLFADADVAWLQDPIEHWDRSFDLQVRVLAAAPAASPRCLRCSPGRNACLHPEIGSAPN